MYKRAKCDVPYVLHRVFLVLTFSLFVFCPNFLVFPLLVLVLFCAFLLLLDPLSSSPFRSLDLVPAFSHFPWTLSLMFHIQIMWFKSCLLLLICCPP